MSHSHHFDWRALGLGLLALTFLAPRVPAQTTAPAPEAPTGRIAKPRSSPRGTWWRRQIRSPRRRAARSSRAGGSAADAAIAVQLVLNLVEPQSSGIGGGAFMVHWDERRKLDDPRRPRDGARRGEARALPRRRRQADEVLRGGGRRPLGRRAGHRPPPRGGAQALGQAAVAAGCSRRRSGSPTTASRSRRASTASSRRRSTCQERSRRPRLFLRGGRHAEAGRHDPEEPGLRQTLRDACASRGADAFYAGDDRRGHRRDRDRPPDEPGRHDPRRSQGLQGRGARAGLRPLPRPIASAAWARRAPAASRSCRSSACSRPSDMAALQPGSGGRALARRGRPPRLRRPGALSRRSGLRERAGARAHRSGLPEEPRRADRARTSRWAQARPAIRRSRRPSSASRPSDGIEFGTSHISVVDRRRQRRRR